MVQAFPDWRFASDAELAVAAGAALLLLAGIALLAERRRSRSRRHNAPDAVGWVPWTGVFLALAMAGMALLGIALPVVMQGG